MKYPRYEYSTESELNVFEFESIGPKGRIVKLVQYTEMNINGYFNLAFGDLDVTTKEINDGV